MMRINIAYSVGLIAVLLFNLKQDIPTVPMITINPNTKFQTITGWEATAQAGQSTCAGFQNYKNALFDQAVYDLGINRIRLEISSGVENPVDYYTKWLNKQISNQELNLHRYEIINDNNNPNLINLNGFQFSWIDFTIDNVVNPLRQRLASKGEQLYINVTYVDFGSSSFEHKDAPQEYAEFVLATYQHLSSKYGWVPDTWEVGLEPNNAQWSGTQVGNAMVAAGNRVNSKGFSARFVAPSNSTVDSAISYFDQIVNIPNALNFLKEFSYHTYSGLTDPNLQATVSRAKAYGISTGMLEHIGADYQELHKELGLGSISSWQQYALAFCTHDDGSVYYWIDDNNPANPIIHIGDRVKFLRQYFKFINRNAVRIGASSDNAIFDPLAFINPDGKYIVVIKANQSGSFSIRSLPKGRYGIKYTTASAYDIDLPDVTINTGNVVNGSIPGAGVITIYGKSNSAPNPKKVYFPFLRK